MTGLPRFSTTAIRGLQNALLQGTALQKNMRYSIYPEPRLDLEAASYRGCTSSTIIILGAAFINPFGEDEFGDMQLSFLNIASCAVLKKSADTTSSRGYLS